MNITSRSRYAIKILMDLAVHRDLPHVARKDIALRQGISSDYLDQIMIRLRRNGLVASVRGRGGGYRLGRAPGIISVWDIFAAVEDSLYPVECVDTESSCAFEAACISHAAWEQIFGGIRRHLMTTTLESLSGDTKVHEMCPGAGPRYCHGGGLRTLKA
jgi:Rrf2 family protein